VNLPETYIKAIENLIGENSIYPSRSELVRVAVREFLIKELEAVKSFSDLQKTISSSPTPNQNNQSGNSEMLIQIPIENNAISDGSPQFKTYRIIKK
jgi:Arc/MetJ-type ribon-helix-helix transcriptional regulator